MGVVRVSRHATLDDDVLVGDLVVGGGDEDGVAPTHWPWEPAWWPWEVAISPIVVVRGSVVV